MQLRALLFGCIDAASRYAAFLAAQVLWRGSAPATDAILSGQARCGCPALQAQAPLGGNPMKELIQYIARSLVDHPEEVQVNEVEGEQTTVLELKVAKEDLGKVIGKQGRTARAMRTILSAASTKCKKRTVLEILE